MGKPVTEKDVFYALEYLGARLCLNSSTGKPVWTLEPGGVRVTPRVADAARAHGSIAASSINGETSYVWKRAA